MNPVHSSPGAVPTSPPDRPRTVTVACALLLVSALACLAQAAVTGTYRPWMTGMMEAQFDMFDLPAYARPDMSGTVTRSLVQTAVMLVVTAAGWVVMALFAFRGKSWARVLVIVFGMIGAVIGPFSILLSVAFATPPATYFATAVPGWLCVLAGMVLLWREPSKSWYQAMRPAPVTPWQGTPAGPGA